MAMGVSSKSVASIEIEISILRAIDNCGFVVVSGHLTNLTSLTTLFSFRVMSCSDILVICLPSQSLAINFALIVG